MIEIEEQDSIENTVEIESPSKRAMSTYLNSLALTRRHSTPAKSPIENNEFLTGRSWYADVLLIDEQKF